MREEDAAQLTQFGISLERCRLLGRQRHVFGSLPDGLVVDKCVLGPSLTRLSFKKRRRQFATLLLLIVLPLLG
jgi:hypothetical protein